MFITDQIFAAYLKCPTKCWLLHKGEVGGGDLYRSWVQYRGDAYNVEGQERLLDAAPTELAAVGSEFQKMKAAQWKYAINVKLETDRLQSNVHFIEQVPSKWKGKPSGLVPGRFIHTNKLNKDDKLILAFDALLLAEVLRSEVSCGKIIHGEEHSTIRIKTQYLAGEVKILIAAINTLLTNDSPPELILIRHCQVCEFQTRCNAKAVENDELSLLFGISITERKKFNSKGIFTLTQLSYTFRPRRHPKRIKNKREKYHHSLKALAIREKKIHIVGNLDIKIEGTPVYLDVEGIPDRGFYYLIGMRIGDCDPPRQYSLWADEREDEKTIWDEFLRVLDSIDQPALIHCGSYETTFLKTMCARYGEPSKLSSAERAISTVLNIKSLIYGRVYYPVFSNSFKDIARYYGYQWSEVLESGLHSIVWREKWEKFREPTFKKVLLNYNAEDCEALEVIVNQLLNLQSSSTNDSLIVDISKLQPKNSISFKREFILPEFDSINKAACWDYQRDRVYLKASKYVKQSGKRESIKRTPLVPDEIINITRRPDSCPHCGSNRIYSNGLCGKYLKDIRFTECGLTKWITRYEYSRYICPVCKRVFRQNDIPVHKYGTGFIAYIIYQGIELMIPFNTINKSINRLFKFELCDSATRPFKALAARLYESTYNSIFNSVCDSYVIHIDETKIDTDNKSCYVWAITTTDKVVYIATETRETGFLQSLLRDFKGVLVSDLYAAYDLINCVQQKCLIHLIRDINDDLYSNPFDEDLKQVATLLKNLLLPIIEAVDKFGLKRHHLKKFIPIVERFYKELFGIHLVSDTANKLRVRLDKYRSKLFVFMEYDGVPWNNNNAEHAIKPFAILRNIIEGNTTEKGLRDYLILLSIRETCKYRGVDFLDFLLSGEKDIDAFATTWKRSHSKPI